MSYSFDSYYNSNPVEEFIDSFFSSGGAAITGVVLTILLICLAIALVISTVVYVCSAFPLYKLAKKLNRPYAWLAWIPILGKYFRLYVLSDLAGDKELVIIPDKVVLKNRQMSFWIYVGIDVLGAAIVGTIIGIFSMIPVIGWIISMFAVILAFVPAVCLGFMDYAYLRDALDLFKEDKQSNKTTSIVVTLLDYLVTSGIAKIVVLFTLLKHEPIPENTVNCEATPVYSASVTEAPSYVTPPVEQAPVAQTPVVNTTPVNTDSNIQ